MPAVTVAVVVLRVLTKAAVWTTGRSPRTTHVTALEQAMLGLTVKL